MPKTQTLGDILKLGELPLEEREQISDAIKYSAEHEGELYTQVSHAKLDGNKTSMTFIRSYLPKIDKTSDRYKNGLLEGVTPDAETINEAEFSVSVMENGWYYKFTNKAVNHAWTDIKARCSKFLTNLFKSYHDEKIADAYLSSANIVTGFDPTKYQDIQRLQTILYKNGGSGDYVFRAAPEVIDAIVFKFKDILEGKDKNELIFKGEVGTIASIRFVKSRLQAFEKTGAGYPFVCYAKNQNGEFPVMICAYDNMAESVILTPLGGLGDDPLKQRGAIGLYVDGHGFYVSDDSVAITGVIDEATLSGSLSTIAGTNLKTDLTFKDEERSQLGRTGAAREIVPEYDYVTVVAGDTLTLKAHKAGGKGAWAIPTEVAAVSGNTGVATISGATLTAKAVGLTTVVLTSVTNPNVKAVMTVEVLAKATA